MSSSINSVYGGNTEYASVGNDIAESHLEIEKYYDEYYKKVSDLYSKTNDWMNGFTNAKLKVERRLTTRKEYDHYDEKLEKVYKTRQEKLKKNSLESASDLDFYQRVNSFIL